MNWFKITVNGLRVCVGRSINDKFNYMYEFEKYPKLTEFIQEMANTGKTPREWSSFIETLNQALRIHDVVGRSEQLACIHNVESLRLIGGNIICLDCKSTWVRQANCH